MKQVNRKLQEETVLLKQKQQRGRRARPCRTGIPAATQSNMNAETVFVTKTDTSHHFRGSRLLLRNIAEN